MAVYRSSHSSLTQELSCSKFVKLVKNIVQKTGDNPFFSLGNKGIGWWWSSSSVSNKRGDVIINNDGESQLIKLWMSLKKVQTPKSRRKGNFQSQKGPKRVLLATYHPHNTVFYFNLSGKSTVFLPQIMVGIYIYILKENLTGFSHHLTMRRSESGILF